MQSTSNHLTIRLKSQHFLRQIATSNTLVRDKQLKLFKSKDLSPIRVIHICLHNHLTQITRESDSSYSVISVKLQRNLSQVATRFNRDCHMIGYILFYKLSVII